MKEKPFLHLISISLNGYKTDQNWMKTKRLMVQEMPRDVCGNTVIT